MINNEVVDGSQNSIWNIRRSRDLKEVTTSVDHCKDFGGRAARRPRHAENDVVFFDPGPEEEEARAFAIRPPPSIRAECKAVLLCFVDPNLSIGALVLRYGQKIFMQFRHESTVSGARR